MRKLIVNEQMSLDGVVQAPGDPEEDRRGDFSHGGWFLDYWNEELLAPAMEQMPHTEAYLFGRRTFEVFASYWPTAPDNIPFTRSLNETAKYVASSTLQEPLTWERSSVLRGDLVAEVTALKQAGEGNIAVLGSTEVVRTLVRHGLVDELTIMMAPVVLGGGRRLFEDDGVRTNMELVSISTSSTGVVQAVYRPTA